jgi:hypothetical protein
VSRRDFRTALVGGIVGALVVGILTPVGAAVGDVMKVGKINKADAATTVKGSSAATLKLVQQNASGVPIKLKGPGGTKRVRYLNADRLDGRHASFFLPRTARAANADKLDGLNSTAFLLADAQAADSDRVDGFDADGLVRVAHAATVEVNETTVFGSDSSGDVLSAQITVPVDGLLHMVGGADSYIPSVGDDPYQCFLHVDDTEVTGSKRGVVVSRPASDAGVTHSTNYEQDCHTNGVQEVAAGTHTVDLHVANRATSAPKALFDEASLQVLFVPFGADGTQPGL